MTSAPYKHPWFFRKKAILIFVLLLFIFEILGGIASYQLYQRYGHYHFVEWNRIYKPLWQAPLIVVMLYLCFVGFWLIFVLKRYRNEMINDLGKGTWRSNDKNKS